MNRPPWSVFMTEDRYGLRVREPEFCNIACQLLPIIPLTQRKWWTIILLFIFLPYHRVNSMVFGMVYAVRLPPSNHSVSNLSGPHYRCLLRLFFVYYSTISLRHKFSGKIRNTWVFVVHDVCADGWDIYEYFLPSVSWQGHGPCIYVPFLLEDSDTHPQKNV